MDIICFMHEGNPYGHLKVNRKVILPANLAVMVGVNLPDAERLLEELEECGVFDRDDQGCIYSKRMVRDETLRNIRAAGGKKGGNPALVKGKVNLKDNHKVGNEDKQKPTPSSSSSPSTSLVVSKDTTGSPSLPFGDLFAESWRQWEKHRREIKKPLQPTQIAAQLAKLSAMTESDAVAMIGHTIEMGWQGLRAPDNGSSKPPPKKSTIEDLMGGRTLNITTIDPNNNEPDDYDDDPPTF